MKKSIIFLLLFFQTVFSQYKETRVNKFSFKPEFNLNYIVPFHSGENYLADATKASFGIGINTTIMKYENFNLGFGFDYINYKITDASKGGNLGMRNLRSIYTRLGYRFNPIKKIEINPYIGIGYARLGSSKLRYGKQEGVDYRIGTNFNYRLNKNIAPFIGICYLKSKFDTNTVPEYTSYFNNSNMIQLVIGSNFR